MCLYNDSINKVVVKLEQSGKDEPKTHSTFKIKGLHAAELIRTMFNSMKSLQCNKALQ